MGMYMTLRAIRQSDVPRLLASPGLIWGVFGQESLPSSPSSQLSAGFWTRLFGPKRSNKEASPSSNVEPSIEPVGEVDLDKAWQVMHFILTGTAWEGDPPMNFLILGGSAVGDIDVGYGPARVLNHQEVRESLVAVASLNEETLRERYNVKVFAEADVYPSVWANLEPEDESADWIVEHMSQLKEFLAVAADRNNGVVISIS